MKTWAVLLCWCVAVFGVAVANGDEASPRERILFDAGWRFALGHATDPARDFNFGTRYFSQFAKAGYADGPADALFDDRAWRQLDLPHDWAVELPFDPRGSVSHGYKAIGRNFPENSIGWYRKTFEVAASDLGRRIAFEFDGVFRDSDVWVNGFHLGHEPSGYSSFRYDVTDYLNYGGTNVVVVRANAMAEEGWFYEGAGIYRHVWLTKADPVHVAPWGTYIVTEVSNGQAEVRVDTTLANESADDAQIDVEQVVLSPAGESVARGSSVSVNVPAGRQSEIRTVITVPSPRLWTLEDPVLHRLATVVRRGGKEVDRVETPFGIRTARFDPDRGFFLNGQRIELKGVNLHQDHAGVGVALPDALQEFRLRQIKQFGANAVRCSHNPPTPEFLDACDRLGILVIDENRLMGSNPAQLGPLERMIRRDRNHPSVILWSLGNEEWAIEGNIKGARIATTMQNFAKRLDPSRRDTVANSGGWGGISTVIDVVGYNYISQSNPDEQHAKFPHQPGVGTEETTTQQTRGIYFDDPAHAHLSPQEHGDSGGNCEVGWKYYAARPFLSGLFFWTGFDYRGEPTPFGWPAVTSQMGLLDLCGFRKDSSYYLEAWWTDHPVLHLATHWNWLGKQGQAINVVAYSNCDSVELFLNGLSLGRQDTPPNGHLDWKVAFQPGVLEARGFRHGAVAEIERTATTGSTQQLRLSVEDFRGSDDGRELKIYTIAALDGEGRLVPTAADKIALRVTGGKILGVGNGDPSRHDPDRFVPTVMLRAIDDWRGRIAPADTKQPGDGSALRPLPELGRWKAPLPHAGERYELAGTVNVDAPGSGAAEIFLPVLGARTSVWLNGQLLDKDIDTRTVGPAIALKKSELVAGDNRVQLVIEPFDDGKNHIPEMTQLGTLRVETPAEAPFIALFNGFAQVIVEADRRANEVRLRAETGTLPAVELASPRLP